MFRRTKRLELRITPEKKAVWKAAAQAEGLTLSGYIQKATDTAVAASPWFTPTELSELAKTHNQIRHVGVNLNQLVRLMHTGEHPDRPDWLSTDITFVSVRDGVIEALDRLNRLLSIKGY